MIRSLHRFITFPIWLVGLIAYFLIISPFLGGMRTGENIMLNILFAEFGVDNIEDLLDHSSDEDESDLDK